MWVGAEYSYGPVTSYAIKNNMDTTAGRWWVWWSSWLTPVAAIEAATGVIINGPSSITLDSDAKQIIIADNTVERGRIIADANLTISSSAGNDLQFDSNSGDFRFQKASAETLRIKNASDDLTLSKELEELTALYQSLISKSESKDKSLKAHVEALSAKNQKIIQKLSDKLIRVERKKQVIAMNRIEQLKSTLFPNGGLQERKENFSSVYLSYGSTLVDELIDSFEIPTKNFLVFQKL